VDFRKRRIILAKMGLDAHDNGIRIISKWLMDAGYDVIYAGLYNSPERILKMTIEENADAIGVSFLGGEHLYYSEKLSRLLKDNGIDKVKIFVGGVIPPDDVGKLNQLGIDAVFTPGAEVDFIVHTIGDILQK